MISTFEGPYSKVPILERSTGAASMTLYDVIVLVFAKILSVTFSGAGPPFETLYLIPKSLSGPPGLCEAVRRIPPYALYLRMTLDAAGVERMAFCPTMNLATPLAEPILRMV